MSAAPGLTPLYLDANATEPLRPAARAAVLAAMDLGGNPSSVHAAGRAARRVLEEAREAVAARFGAQGEVRPQDVVFTSGGTEANALALRGIGRGRRLLVGATEHPAVLAAAPGAGVLPVLADGTLDLAALEAALAAGGPALVALMAANNETGVLHPLEAAAELCRRHGALLHVDAVQAAGRVAVPAVWDSLALSGHKLGGPPGAGALLLRAGLDVAPLIAGGGQERGRRGGTEPLPAIAGMAAALADATPEAAAGLAGLRDAIEAGAAAACTSAQAQLGGAAARGFVADAAAQGLIADASARAVVAGAAAPARIAGAAAHAFVAGAGAPRLPNTTCLVLHGVAAETQVIALDIAGIRVSAGAACSSGKVARSPVLAAMGFGDAAGCGIRVSLPWNAPADAAERFLAAWAAMRDRLSRRAA